MEGCQPENVEERGLRMIHNPHYETKEEVWTAEPQLVSRDALSDDSK